MKKTLITISKIILGILAISIPFKAVIYLAGDVIEIYEYTQLKWVALLICAIGFYISGLINSKTSLKIIPLLYVSLLLFIPLRCFYFPLIYFLCLFATISLLLTRKEINRKVKWPSFTLMAGLFIYFLFSQPLIIKPEGIIKKNQYGELTNGNTIWDFSEEKSKLLPESVFIGLNDKELDLKSLKNKTLYISFWATWCGPCRQEKPELEKLKNDFKNNPNIVFIDISVDHNKENWKKFIDSNKPTGIQLISKDYAKTRNLFELPGIPAHIVANSEGKYAKERSIQRAHKLLSDSIYLDGFINKRLPEVAIKQNRLEDFRIIESVKPDSTKVVYYTTTGKNRLLANQLNTLFDIIRKKQNKKFANLLIEKKPISNKDSIIYKVQFYLNNIDPKEIIKQMK